MELNIPNIHQQLKVKEVNQVLENNFGIQLTVDDVMSINNINDIIVIINNYTQEWKSTYINSPKRRRLSY